MMDLDGLKQVNDALGHLAGDEILCALGDALSVRLRSSDHAAQFGGDEFAVLLIGADAETAERVACELATELSAAVSAVREHVHLPSCTTSARSRFPT